MPETYTPIEIYCSASLEDMPLMQTLEKHLSQLILHRQIILKHRGSIVAGDLEARCEQWLDHAQVILLLISADFLSSSACVREQLNAMRRSDLGEAKVIPILARFVARVGSPYERLVALPRDGGFIRSSQDEEQAWAGVVTELHQMLHLSVLSGEVRLVEPMPAFWTVPFERNPIFTGRDGILKEIFETFFSNPTKKSLISQALCGLGGIGKTQIALEYAYCYRAEYKAVFWVRADSKENLILGFARLAVVLGVSEKQNDPMSSSRGVSLEMSSREATLLPQHSFQHKTLDRTNAFLALPAPDDTWTSQAETKSPSDGVSEMNRLRQAVKQWFHAQANWLLIFDNVEDVNTVMDFLPLAGAGHILLTTQAQSVGHIALSRKIEPMASEESIYLLLRRSKITEVGPDSALAGRIVELMGGNPLALDQAGAYIEETSCGLSTYLSLYLQQRAELLKKRGGFDRVHPDSIVATLSLCVTRLQIATSDNEVNKASEELLYLCAFLDPVQILENIVKVGCADFEIALQKVVIDELKWNETIRALLKFSLVKRNYDQGTNQLTLTLHRLVKVILQDGLDKKTQLQWAMSAVKAVSRAFGQASVNERDYYLSQVQVCLDLIEEYRLTYVDAGLLLHQAGHYNKEQNKYTEAEAYLRHALRLYEQQIAKPEDPALLKNLVKSIDDLAEIYYIQKDYKQAEPLLQRALNIREHESGLEHPDNLNTLDTLVELYYHLGKYRSATSLCQRAFGIREREQGSENAESITTLEILAKLYNVQGKYEQARALFQQGLDVREQIYGRGHLSTAQSLNNLGMLYHTLGNYQEAEVLFQRALAILETQPENDHADTANNFDHLARLFYTQEKYAQAETFFQRSLATRERVLGLEHPETAQSLSNLAILYRAQGKYQEAEALFERSLDIRKRLFGQEHPDIAQSYYHLAVLDRMQGKGTSAKVHLEASLTMYKALLEGDHPVQANVLNEFALLYLMQKEFDQAEKYAKQAYELREKLLGPKHPNTTNSMMILAAIRLDQGKYPEAKELLEKGKTFYEEALGPGHSNTANTIDRLAVLYLRQRDYGQAEKLFKEALAIRENALGVEHVEGGGSLYNLAVLYQKQGKHGLALEYCKRALAIYEKSVGGRHPKTLLIQKTYYALQQKQGN